MAVVDTTHGRVEGEARGNQHAFRGIPFAQPPLGSRRFCPPEPPEPWTGTRDATQFGPSAMQMPSALPGMGAREPFSEDCLYLNVYTPAPDGARRPVLFWIHGGAFTLGSGSGPLYDGKTFVSHGDVVVVTINYRLGAFGYMSLGEHGGDAWGATSNAGQLDQIAALEWVRDNIERFGGDPDNVTIFGESAGSFAVAMLLAMPRALGLFHRAIAQSGADLSPKSARAQSVVAGSIMAALGIDPTESQKLQDVPAEMLLKAQAAVPGEMLTTYWPVVDGKTVPVSPGEAIAAGTAARVPLLIGSNRDEMNLFMGPMLKANRPVDDEHLTRTIAMRLPEGARGRVDTMVQAYRRSRTGLGLPCSNLALLSAVQTDITFRIPAIRYAEAYARRQPATFMYLFRQESPAMRGALSACHALEIPFVFGTLDAPSMDRFVGVGEGVERLSRTMMDAWLAFARSGDPSTPALEWRPFEPRRRPTMVLDATPAMHDAPHDDERAVWDGVL